jgi:hypothetical protein
VPAVRPVQLLLVAACGATWAVLLGVGPVNYDTASVLLWGEQLREGSHADLGATLAPTPKPLLLPVGLLAPSDEAGDAAVLTLAAIALGALAAAAADVTRTLSASTPAATLAALLVLTREPVLSFGLRAYPDVLAAALVVTALALELRSRRPALVLVALAAAGLLRPEAWALSGAYAVWVVLRGRGPLPLLVLAAAAPALWALHDLVLQADPLWSLRGTRGAAADLGRTTGLDGVLVAPRRLGEIVREPVLLAAAAGGAGLLLRRPPGALALATTSAALLAAFAALSSAGLPALGRYLLPLAVLLCVAAAAGVGLALRAGPGARALRLAAAAAGVWALVLLPSQAGRLERTTAALQAQRTALQDLRAIAQALPGSCAPLRLPNHRLVPHLARLLDRPATSFALTPFGPGTAVLPADRRAVRALLLDPRDRPAIRASLLALAPERPARSAWRVVERCAR